MYKKIVLIILIANFCLLTSCSNNNNAIDQSKIEKPEVFSKQEDDFNLSEKYTVNQNGIIMNYLETIDTIYKSDDNYTIYTDGFSFRYIVKDNSDNVLDIGYHDYRGSFDLYSLGKLLVLDYGSGGNSGTSKRFYDLEKGQVSRFYSNPIAVSDTKVAFFAYNEKDNKEVLIIQGIFNTEDYYKEIERNFPNGTAVFYDTKATFLENGKKLEITYPIKTTEKGESLEYKTEVIILER